MNYRFRIHEFTWYRIPFTHKINGWLKTPTTTQEDDRRHLHSSQPPSKPRILPFFHPSEGHQKYCHTKQGFKQRGMHHISKTEF